MEIKIKKLRPGAKMPAYATADAACFDLHAATVAECQHLGSVVHAKKMDEEFRVYPLEGNYKQGKPGDYLMCGIEGELYICDGEIFEKSYDFVQEG